MSELQPLKRTPGRWRWEVNLKSRQIQLCGGKSPFDLTVVDFVRWGMGGAQPRFRDGKDLMQKASDFAVVAPGREHHESWFRLVDHPDARLMESAPELLDSVNVLFELLAESIAHGMPVTERVADARNKAAELLKRNGVTE
jgi:hypothetical protein